PGRVGLAGEQKGRKPKPGKALERDTIPPGGLKCWVGRVGFCQFLAGITRIGPVYHRFLAFPATPACPSRRSEPCADIPRTALEVPNKPD
ncbi:hypothetical protein, partial [Achromobacter sp. AGC39]